LIDLGLADQAPGHEIGAFKPERDIEGALSKRENGAPLYSLAGV
jgi:hypothetical protein